jgi:hypothetical protein
MYACGFKKRRFVQFLPLNMVIFKRVREIVNSDCWLRHVCPFVSLSALPHGITELPRDGFSLK